MAINAPPAGAMIQNGAVVLPNGQPYTSGGMPVYAGSGGTYTTTNPNAPAPSYQPNPVISQPSYLGLYNPYGMTIGTPPPSSQTSATGYVPPEFNALKQIGQIDPGYLGQVNQLQSQYQTLGRSYMGNLKLARQGQLPPGVQREIQQQAAAQEAGTGNTAGVAQAVQQGMTTGTAGLNYLQSTLGQAQNYLQQKGAYLGSGVTPYGIGSAYVDRAQNQQNAAMSGGMMPPTYNPYANSAPAFQYINPNTGAEFAQGATGFMNAGAGATPGSPDTMGQFIGPAIGAIGSIGGGLASSGALSGALAGLGAGLAAF